MNIGESFFEWLAIFFINRNIRMESSNNTLNICMNLNASIILASKLAFYIHNFGKKIAIKIRSHSNFKNLGIGYNRLKFFILLLSMEK